jgi:hypothetical protein
MKADDFVFKHSDNMSLFLKLRKLILTDYKNASRPKTLKTLAEYDLF